MNWIYEVRIVTIDWVDSYAVIEETKGGSDSDCMFPHRGIHPLSYRVMKIEHGLERGNLISHSMRLWSLWTIGRKR